MNEVDKQTLETREKSETPTSRLGITQETVLLRPPTIAPTSPTNKLLALALRPHVLHSPYDCILIVAIVRLLTDNQQCLEHLRDTHEEGSANGSTGRPTAKLRFSGCHF